MEPKREDRCAELERQLPRDQPSNTTNLDSSTEQSKSCGVSTGLRQHRSSIGYQKVKQEGQLQVGQQRKDREKVGGGAESSF
jgi:hypothetical protein